MSIQHKNKKDEMFIGWILALLAANIVVFSFIIFYNSSVQNAFYFFNSINTDSSMILYNNARFIIDTGNKDNIIGNLEKVMSPLSKYIDVVVLSNTSVNYAEGLLAILKYYEVGVVIYNGKQSNLWNRIRTELQTRNIPYIKLKRGDSITYKNAVFNIIWPTKSYFNSSKSIGGSSLATNFCNKSICVLYTGGITNKIENTVVDSGKIKSYILNISNNSSKHIPSKKFLEAVNPRIIVVKSGKNNYGDIIAGVLRNISKSNVKIYDVGKFGIVKIINNNNALKIFRIE